MKTQLWLVSALSTALVGSIMSISLAQAETAPPAQGAPAKPGPTVDEEGPFAPKGRTGKLKEEAPAPQEEKEAVEAAGKPGRAGIDLVVGFGKLGTATRPISATVFSFVLGGSYKVAPNISLSLGIPIATGSITPTGGDKFNSTAFGNVALGLS